MSKKPGINSSRQSPGAKYSILPEPQNSEILLPVAPAVHFGHTANPKNAAKSIFPKRTTKNSQKLKLFPD